MQPRRSYDTGHSESWTPYVVVIVVILLLAFGAWYSMDSGAFDAGAAIKLEMK